MKTFRPRCVSRRCSAPIHFRQLCCLFLCLLAWRDRSRSFTGMRRPRWTSRCCGTWRHFTRVTRTRAMTGTCTSCSGVIVRATPRKAHLKVCQRTTVRPGSHRRPSAPGRPVFARVRVGTALCGPHPWRCSPPQCGFGDRIRRGATFVVHSSPRCYSTNASARPWAFLSVSG